MNTYFDIPELLKYPLPFTAEDILLDSDFDLQDGHQPAVEVFNKATNIAWTTNEEAPNLQIGFLKNKQISRLMQEWALDIFPDNFFTKAYYKRPNKSFPATLVMTKPSETTRWHYEGFYPWTKTDEGFARTSCVLNIKFKANEDSDIVFGQPNNFVLNTIEQLYKSRTPEQDVQWCENKNIRSNFYSDAIMTIDENVTEIDRKVNYDCPFLLNLGHMDTHPNPWHRVENSRATEPRISFRLMCNENLPMQHWVDLHKKGNLLNEQ